jgi:hypothetical protein
VAGPGREADRVLTDPYELIELWERGRTQHPVDRALTLVGAVHRDASRRELAEWCLGDRDAALLSLYRSSFGDTLDATGTCPDCRAAVEAQVRIAELPVEGRRSPTGDGEVSIGGRTIRFRLPNSTDVAAIVGAPDPKAARAELVRRLVGEEVGDLSREDASRLEAAIEDAAPLTEISVVLACPECGCSWVESLDVAAFVWTHVAARAERLLWQVVRLAHAYGWTERDVLALSPARRQWYVEAAER